MRLCVAASCSEAGGAEELTKGSCVSFLPHRPINETQHKLEGRSKHTSRAYVELETNPLEAKHIFLCRQL